MKKHKQFLSALLVMAMIATLLTGCGGKKQGGENEETNSNTGGENEETNSNTGDDDADKVIELTVAGPSGATAVDWNSTIQFEEYEKRLGLKLDATTYTNEAWSSKVTLMLAGNEMPDILAMGNSPMSRSDLEKYAADGYFLDLSKYLDLMPHLKEYMELYPEYAKAITANDGSIYGLTYLNDWCTSTLYPYVFLSQSWLDNVGMERPETLDDLYQVLKAFKEQDANGNGDPDDEIPMGLAGSTYFASELPILWAFGINSRDYAFFEHADENGKVGLWDASDNYKAFLKYMNKLYEEELINQDAYVIDPEELKSMAEDGKIGLIGGWGDVCGKDNALMKAMEWYVPVGFTDEDYNTEKSGYVNSAVNPNFRLVVNADTKYPERIAEFIDYLFTPEGSTSAFNGYEGITFDLKEIAGYKVVKDMTAYAQAAGFEKTEDYRNQRAIAPAAFALIGMPNGTIYEMLRNIDEEALTDVDGECFGAAGANALREKAIRTEGLTIMERFPALPHTEEELQERATLYTDIRNYLITAKAQFITGEKDIDASWDAHIKTLNEMGLERLLEIDQAAYDRYLNK